MPRNPVVDGVWPTMVTPFTEDNRLDLDAIPPFVDWLVSRGVAGLFAVCQSSEMFLLSLRERLALARAVVRASAGRVPVIASGHVADSAADQLEEARAMADTGIDALVLLTNRFAAQGEPDDLFKESLDRFLEGFRVDLPLGFYECPHPYKRVLSPELVAWCASTRRFAFLKDTCLDLDLMRRKREATAASGFRVFNANAATLLESLKLGLAGYSGVMANFHPELYSWLCRSWRAHREPAERLQELLGLCSAVEYQQYPVNAKYFLRAEGLPFTLRTRVRDARTFTRSFQMEIEQLRAVSRRAVQELR
jgi:4-hydroxy-tetrahydrodipicolinate synthase